MKNEKSHRTLEKTNFGARAQLSVKKNDTINRDSERKIRKRKMRTSTFFHLGCSSSFIVSRFPDERLQTDYLIDFFEKLREDIQDKIKILDIFEDSCIKKSKIVSKLR
jgi:hypothetical protein